MSRQDPTASPSPGVAYTQVPLDPVAESQPHVDADLDFILTAAAAKIMAQIIVSDGYVVPRWSEILYDFLNVVAEQRKAASKLERHKYERGVMYTLQCWIGQNGGSATFRACLEKLEARHCCALVSELKEHVDQIRSACVRGHGQQISDPRDKSGRLCGFFRKKLCLLPGGILLLLIATCVFLAVQSWSDPEPKPVRSAEQIEDSASRLAIAGRPGKYKKLNWAIQARPDVQLRKLRYLNLTYIHLGSNPNKFQAWLAECAALRTLYLHHIMWDGGTEIIARVQLPELANFHFIHDMNSSPPPKCSAEAVAYVNSLFFFYKTSPGTSTLEHSTSMGTSISISTNIPIRTDGHWRDQIVVTRTWFELNLNEGSISMDGLPSTLLDSLWRDNAGDAFPKLKFSGCALRQSDSKRLGGLRVLTVENAYTGKGVLGQILRSMYHLEILHIENPSEVIDLCDIMSGNVRELRIFNANLTASVPNCHSGQMWNLKKLHLHNAKVDDRVMSSFATSFAKVTAFVLTHEGTEWGLNDQESRIVKGIQTIVEPKGENGVVTMMYELASGDIRTHSCDSDEHCPRDPCIPPTEYAPFEYYRFSLDEICQSCVAGCHNLPDKDLNLERRRKNRRFEFKPGRFKYTDPERMNGFVFVTDE